MRTAHHSIPLFCLALILGISCTETGDTRVDVSPGPSAFKETASQEVVEAEERSEDCSARHARGRVRLSFELPAAVRKTAAAIAQTAWACDFEGMVDLGMEGRDGFGGPIGFPKDMDEVWDALDPCEKVARNAIDLLAEEPAVRDGQKLEVFPSADDPDPIGIEGDIYVWPADADSEEYRGFRSGIHEDGDWLFFANGTFLYEGCRKKGTRN